MNTLDTAAWACLLLPLGATLVITAAGTRISRKGAGLLSTLTTAGAFAAAVVAFAKLASYHPDNREHVSTSWTWLSAGKYQFGLTLLTDPLSTMMMLIVTGVGALIVAYSVGYMDGDDEERRFFAYMSLFVFSMLLLVQAGNFLILLAGWGMVGLSSYLLIGYHQDRPAAVAAAKKAFVMNAFGDAAMVLALFLLVQHTGTLNFGEVFASAPTGGTVANLIALGLLGGAVAKSAQIPLHTWLPDAMEGPTPVSALIHAATMVTAGVYLIVRCHTLFENAKYVEDLAAGLGAATLLMAGLIALVQVDIKRVIAYSTMSQIGFMFVGAAAGAYTSAMFHLMTHAFFKALLFLAAGIVIHALTGEQDIRKMAGIGRRLPQTRIAFLIGCLALVGLPPFAGFFSKDSIIAATMDRGAFGYVLLGCCLVGTFLTGLYTFRLFFIVFTGKPSTFAEEHLHLHGDQEGSGWMTWTVLELAALTLIAGFIQVQPFWHPLNNWLAFDAPNFAVATDADEAIASIAAVLVGLLGIAVAWRLYYKKTAKAPKPSKLLEKKFYWDEAYDLLFYKPAVATSLAFARFIERPLIAGSIRWVSGGFGLGSRELGRAQNGLVRSYALALASGLAVLVIVFVSVK
jgi:NADH-quinone oxidoreductase subunit L